MISMILPLSSSSWFLIWLGLELNLILFIFICIIGKNVFSSERRIKYFLVQASGSIVLLLCFSVNCLFYDEITQITLLPPLALALKRGIAPLHGWVPEVARKFNYFSLLLFFTLQKLNPLIICFYSWSEFMFLLLFFNLLVGAIGGINQSSIFMLLVYSSINNIGWIILSLADSFRLFLVYYFIYCLLNSIFIFFCEKYNLKWIAQLKIQILSKKIVIFSNFLSLRGLPPFLGFFTKWLTIYALSINFIFFVGLAIFSSVITLFFYVKIIITNLTLYVFTNKWLSDQSQLLNSILISLSFLFNCSGIFIFNLFLN